MGIRIVFIFSAVLSAVCAVRYGYALSGNRHSSRQMRGVVSRQASFQDSRDRDSSSQQVESSGASDFHQNDFPTLHQPRPLERSLERSFEKSFENNDKDRFSSNEFDKLESSVPKKNIFKPIKKIPCPFLNPWLDAVAHPDSDPECGHGMPGWRAHPSCRCHFLVKDRDEFGCALKFFTRCKLDNFAVLDTESVATTTTEQPWTTRRQFSTLRFRPTTRARPSFATTTRRFTTTRPAVKTTTKRFAVTTTRRPAITTTKRTTTRRPITTTTQEIHHFDQDVDDEESEEGTGLGFDYIMGTRIVADEKKQDDKDNAEVSLPGEFGHKDDEEEEPQFLIGRRIRRFRRV